MSEKDHWEQRYREGDTPWDTGHPSSQLERVLADVPIAPGPALELGCGTGTNAVWLAQQGFEVTAVDISPLALEHARQRAAAAGVSVRFLNVDVLAMPDLGGPYGFFFDRGCYHVVRRVEVQSYLRALQQATQAGTLGLVLAGNAREPHSPGPPVVTEEEIRAELGTLFEVLRLQEFRFDQEEAGGVRYLGWSCLVRRS
jgi:cyclopropane fatty-acyl-phospholipid synthase-like methyltransferase